MGRRSNYTAKQKAEVVLSVLSKQITIAEACRRHGITETTFARWREQAVTAMEKGLEDRGGGASSREAELEHEIAILERKLGQLAVIADLRGKDLRRAVAATEKADPNLPLLHAMHDRMAEAVHAGLGNKDWSAVAEYSRQRLGPGSTGGVR